MWPGTSRATPWAARCATAWRRWSPWQIWTRSSPNWTGAAPTRVRPSKGPGAGPARPSGPWSPRGGWTRGTSPPIMLIASTRRSWTPPEDESMTTEHLDPGTAARDAAPPGYSPADLERFAPEPPKRSEEHTSELQSRGHLVCRLLLE